MLQFLQANLLLGLIGLLIPLAIHLWNRREGKRVLFGSIQLLIASEEKKISSIRFTQPLVFLLRSILLGLFVLLIMEPGKWIEKNINQESKIKKWLLVESNQVENLTIKIQLDALQKQGYEIRLLEKDFPKIGEEQDSQKNRINYWSLLKTLNAKKDKPDSVLILARTLKENFWGEKPSINLPIEWRPIPIADAIPFLLTAQKTSNNKINLKIGWTNEDGNTIQEFEIADDKKEYQLVGLPKLKIEENEGGDLLFFENQKANTIFLAERDTLNIAIYYTADFANDASYLQAAIKTIDAITAKKIWTKSKSISQYKIDEEQADYVFYLNNKPLKNIDLKNEEVQYIKFDNSKRYSNQLFKKENKQYTLTQRIYPTTANKELNPNLPHELLKLFFEKENKKLNLKDHRVLAVNEILPIQKEQETKTILASQSLSNKKWKDYHWPISLGIVLLFFMERIIDYKKIGHRTIWPLDRLNE